MIVRFLEFSRAGTPNAWEQCSAHGLDIARRRPLGLALQRLLEQADNWAQETNLETAAGEIWITPRRCDFEIGKPQRWSCETAY